MNRTMFAAALGSFVALAAGPAFAGPTDDLKAAMIRTATLSSYEVTFTTGGHGGTIDIVKPDNMHMRASGVEMIRIKKITYMKTGGVNWMKVPDSSGGRRNEVPDQVLEMTKRANQLTATDLGMKSVDGETMHAYRVKQHDGSDSTVFVGRDGYLHRVDSGANGVIRLSKFNAVAPIRAPI